MNNNLMSHIMINVDTPSSNTMGCKETLAFQSLMHSTSFFFSFAAISECASFNTFDHIWNHCV